MRSGSTLVASLLATLAAPTLWPLALAAFLIRGGLVLLIAPIIAIPSAVGFANVVAPALTSFVFGRVSIELIVLILTAVALWIVWLVGGGLLAARLELEATRVVSDGDDPADTGALPADPGPRPRARDRWKVAQVILAARLFAHVPLAVAISWGSSRLVASAYVELTNPSQTGVPVIVRVVRSAPEAIVVIALAWIVGEIVGSMAARRAVLADAGFRSALGGAIRTLVRRPVRAAILWLVPTLAAIAILVPVALAASTALDAVRAALTAGSGPPGAQAVGALVFLALFVGVWVGGLVLLGVATAWRSATWTVDAAGTFGLMDGTRPGDWNATASSGTLVDLRPRGVDPDAR